MDHGRCIHKLKLTRRLLLVFSQSLAHKSHLFGQHFLCLLKLVFELVALLLHLLDLLFELVVGADSGPDEVPLDHGSCVFDKALEAFPSGLFPVLPFDFELNHLSLVDFVHSVASDTLYPEPALIFGLNRLWRGLFELLFCLVVIEFLQSRLSSPFSA